MGFIPFSHGGGSIRCGCRDVVKQSLTSERYKVMYCLRKMTQVLQHDYGKSKVTLLEIRAAIKAVKAIRLSEATVPSKRANRKVGKKTAARKSG